MTPCPGNYALLGGLLLAAVTPKPPLRHLRQVGLLVAGLLPTTGAWLSAQEGKALYLPRGT